MGVPLGARDRQRETARLLRGAARLGSCVWPAMSYDLSLNPEDASNPPSVDRVRAFLAGRPHWKAFESSFSYDNEDSGTSFRVHVRDVAAPAEAGEEPAAWMSLTMAGSAAHVAGIEICREVTALARELSLTLDDPQMEGMGKGPLDEAKLLAGWTFYNAFSIKVNCAFLNNPVPPHASKAKLEAAFRWNEGRGQLGRGGSTFVPKIMFARHDDGTVATCVAWAGVTGLLPEVDLVITPLGALRWADLDASLAKARVESEPAPHRIVDAKVAKAIGARMEQGCTPPPRLVSASEVHTTEDLAPYLGGVDDLTAEVLVSRAQMAQMSGDYPAAFESARAAFRKEPGNASAATLAALAGVYVAEFDEALPIVEALLETAPSKTAHILHCAVLTDLARYRGAAAAARRALEHGPDPMVENMLGDALAHEGEAQEAAVAYKGALAKIEEQLEANPEDGDVVSRKAYALLGLGMHKEALKVAKRALSLVREPFLTLQSIGRAELALGQPKKAIAAIKKMDTSKRAAPLAAYVLALAYAQLGKLEEAAEALADARKSPHVRGLVAREPLLADL